MDNHNPTPNRIDWDAWRRGWRGAKRRGQQIEGPCPITGEGVNACHVNLQDDCAGCRKCGDGSGKLTAAQLVEHARAAGAVEVDLTGGAGRWPEWTWTTASGRERRQYRTPDGSKIWAKTDPPNNPPPSDLMYLPGGVPSGPGPIYVCEGATDALAVQRLGLSAIGRTNARPSVASLARLDRGAVYRVWPDVDDDQAGYKQAVSWAAAATLAGLTVEAVDPLKLRPDAPPGYDARDWIAGLSDGATAEDAAVLLAAAVVDVKVMRSAPISAPAAAPAPDTDAPRPVVAYSVAGLSRALDHLRLAVRFNIRSKVEEIRHGGERWERISGGDRDVLRADLFESASFPARGKDADDRPARWAINELRSHVGALAHRQRVDPFLDWVRTLPAWDRTPRIDTWLSTVLPVAAVDPEYLTWCSRSVLLAAVQRAECPGLKHDHVVVLVGPQGALKSTVWRLLFPDSDQAEWFSDGLDLREERKGMTEAVQGRVIVEVSELVTRRADLERVKAWVRQVDDGAVRLAYRTDPEPSPRRFVIVATSNGDDCLPDDPTGNRTFSPLRVGGEADGPAVYQWMGATRDQLWAEAWARRDEQAWMPKGMERGTQRLQSDQFSARNMAAENAIDHFMTKHGGAVPWRMTDVIDSLPEGERARWTHDPRELGRVLAARGYVKNRDRHNGIRGTWWRYKAANLCPPCPPSVHPHEGGVHLQIEKGKSVLHKGEGGHGWTGWTDRTQADEDMPPGSLDCYANGGVQESADPPDRPVEDPPNSSPPVQADERPLTSTERTRRQRSKKKENVTTGSIDPVVTSSDGPEATTTDRRPAPIDRPTGKPTEAPPLAPPANGNGAAARSDLATLIVGWGERPTDASAALRLGEFLTDTARRRGTLPEGQTAGTVAAHLLQTARGVH